MTAPFRTPQAYAAYWPFNWLTLYTDMAQDVGRYTRTLAECTDAMEAMRAEGLLALSLWDDLARAYADLAAMSWTAMAVGLAEQANGVDVGIWTAEVRRFPTGAGVSSARRDPTAR
jgi:hypothetical protein